MNDELQRTSEWRAKRRGKFSSSTFGDLMKKGKSKDEIFSVAGKTLIMEKATEILSDNDEEISSKAMEHGTYYESEALELYEQITGNKLTEVGFVELKGYENYAGGSPDGLVSELKESGEEKGICEVKCPYNTINHIETLMSNKIPEKHYIKYYTQMQMNMLCTDRQWCDFISYDPRMINEKLRLCIIRINRDEKFISEILTRLKLAIEKLKQIIEEIELKVDFCKKTTVIINKLW